ncbi:DBR1-domain-containing protein, partial [Fomitiporia mediterranea MF3/22]|uniref:DBR1-domain-containing protein n=1 Tax=Fomitiporia mediterranea (strain MF3/22) TaxID=694068 RepID=UPI0004408C0C
IAIEGCCHGQLDSIYEHISQLEKQNNYKVDCLLICGDFQAMRNHQDLQCMAVPDKYKRIGGFYRYYTGEKTAPILTLVIGGNHEASNYMWELYHGGWLAPNIYFLGFAGCVQVNGIRIAGLSGIYAEHHYKLGHFEAIPYNNGALRSIYHVREYDIFRLSQLSSADIVLSHDWPQGIAKHGDADDLLRRKPFFRSDIESNVLGSPPAMQLLRRLKPSWWFSAHLHCRFEATVVHEELSYQTRTQGSWCSIPGDGNNPDEIVIDDLDDDLDPESAEAKPVEITVPSEAGRAEELPINPDEILLDDELEGVAAPPPVRDTTKFLALDKCLPRRQFLEVVDVPCADSPETPRLMFDPEWLAITRAFHPYLSIERLQPRLPDTAEAKERVKQELEWVTRNISDRDVHDCQVFWPTAPGPGSEGPNRNRQPPWFTNLQTEAFCDMLQLENKVNPVPKNMPSRPPAVA